ncbi:MAG: hypothetical protein QM662_00320 [Gordonia sp. (in: high G+C Gram-positive bacteria)]
MIVAESGKSRIYLIDIRGRRDHCDMAEGIHPDNVDGRGSWFRGNGKDVHGAVRIGGTIQPTHR